MDSTVVGRSMKQEDEWGEDTSRSRKMGGVDFDEGKNGGSIVKRRKNGVSILRGRKKWGSTHLWAKALSI